MSALRSLSVLTALSLVGLYGFAIQKAYADPNTQARPAAKPKALAPAKRPPVHRPAAVPAATPAPQQGSFAVPEEDTWYNAEKWDQTYTQGIARSNQLGVVGVVNYFGSGAGLEYIRSFSPFSLALSALYTSGDLEDKQSPDGQNQNETVEFFATKSTYLRAHGRYTFFRYVYVSAGLTLDNISGTYGWRGSAINGGEIKADFSSTVVTGDLLVGTEIKGPWGTYFGIDWLGTSLPLSSSTKVDDNPGLDLTSRALKNARPDQRIGDETNAQLRIYYLNLRVGYAF